MENSWSPIPTATVLVVDSDAAVRKAMADLLAGEGYHVLTVGTGTEALACLKRQPVEVLISDVTLPEGRGQDLLRRVRDEHSDTVVLFITGYGSIESAVEAIRQGAYDYLTRPIVDDDVRLAVRRALQQQRLLAENRRLRAAITAQEPPDGIIGQDYRMLKVFELIDAVSDSSATVLLTGESGTGKSLVARAIHQHSRRSGGPFVEVSCAALPETLLESELFGHVKGAFTDASSARLGKFAAADGGTIFLDEIASSSPGLQAKLLRVLQERAFEPVGSNRTQSADARVILATNHDLEQEVRAGRFRRDLYYRVNVVNIELPPLRQRTADIALLADHFLRHYQRQNGKVIAGFAESAARALQSYAWPGNVRELENSIERAVVLCRGGRIDVADLPPTVGAATAASAESAAEAQRTLRQETTSSSKSLLLSLPSASSAPLRQIQTLRQALTAAQRRLLQEALAAHGGSRQAAARALGINRTTLYKKMKRLGLPFP